MRFNSTEHLDTFARTGMFPRVHKPLLDFIATHATVERFCDVGSGLGLLAEELSSRMGLYVVGVDKSADFNRKARDAGVKAPLVTLRILPSSFDEFASVLREHRVEALVCRRSVDVWHEIGDLSIQQGKAGAGTLQGPGWHMTEFAELCRDAGVREVFLQGDNRPSRWEVEFDIKCFAPVYALHAYEAPTRAYLRLA
jgi:hypothetical protein